MANPFAKASKLIADTLEANSIAYRNEFSVSMLQRFARDTPIDTGRATGNWILQGGSPNLKPVTFTDKTSTAMPTTNKARKATKGIKIKEDVYVSNAVQGDDGSGYIIGLENGKSKQAPLGMFKINLVQAKEVSKVAVRRAIK